MKRIKEIIFNSPDQIVNIASYDKAKVVASSFMQQKTGALPENNFIGPWPTGMTRPGETSTNIPATYPHVIDWNDTTMYVALADLSTAAGTRRITMFEYNKLTQIFAWRGFITLTYPFATAHTIRGLRVVDYYYTTGTVSVSGNTVTGTGTAWLSSGIAVGSRIAFGTTDHKSNPTWYEVTAITSNTSMTIATSAPTVTNVPYVNEELRIITATTNATVASGGLFLVKGLHWGVFTQTGLVIPAATTVDNIRAVYGLRDNMTTGTLTTATGCAVDDSFSWTKHDVYVPNSGASTFHIFKFNIRAPLTNLVAGNTLDALICKTGNTTLVGTISQLNNGRIATLNHSSAAGVRSLFFITTSRVYRVPLTEVIEANINYLVDSMVENPKGSTTTVVGAGGMQSLEYAPSLDRLIINGGSGSKSYVTRYRTDSGQFDLNFLNEHRYLNATNSDPAMALFPSVTASTFGIWAEGGVLFMARSSGTTTYSQLYSICIGADNTFTPDQYVITPSIPIPDATKLYKVLVNNQIFAGDPNYCVTYEPYRLFYRTSGIADNSGAWTLVANTGDLTGVLSTEIQFKFDFKTLGSTCLPARIHSLSLVYEDSTTDSNYEPSISNSNLTNRNFVWRQISQFTGTQLPNLRVRLYDVTTVNSPGLLISDYSDTSSLGIWNYSTNNGTSWLPWNKNANAVGNLIRFTPTVLPTAKKLRALLTQ
jgi:hypothetical protein